MDAPTESPEVPAEKPVKNLRQLAIDIEAGLVFGSWNFPSDDEALRMMHLVFIPLAFMSKESLAEMSETVHMYEYYNKSGPRSCNGYPGFFSMYMLSKTEWEILRPLIVEVRQRNAEFLTSPS